MINKDDNIVLEYEGKFYKNYSVLLDQLTNYGKDLDGWDEKYLYAMERWIVVNVLKKEVKEHELN